MVLSPVAAELDKRVVIVVPDETLNFIPFQILPLSPGTEPMVAKLEVVNAPSGSILGDIRKEVAQRQPATKVLAAFGDPMPKLMDTVAAVVDRVDFDAADTAPAIGKAFLALARGDSAGAAAQFAQAAENTPAVRSVLLLTSAQIHASMKHDAEAAALWQRIIDKEKDSPEAPQAELEWARMLRRKNDAAGASAHLEHMILAYPQSALVPQARRELELAKSSIPPTLQ